MGATRPLPPGLQRAELAHACSLCTGSQGPARPIPGGGTISTQTSVRLGCAVRPGEPERESPGGFLLWAWAGGLGKCVCV